jgi:hypothetical protein
MKKIKLAFLLISISILCLAPLSATFAQTISGDDNKPSYSVYTYVIIGSNKDAGQSKISAELSKSLEDVRNEFGYSNFHIVSTHFQNVKEDGRVAYGSMLKGRSLNIDTDKPVFTNLSLNKLYKNGLDESRSFGFKTFRFAGNVPYISSSNMIEGKKVDNIDYTKIDTSSNDVGISLDKPTVVGSLPVGEQALFFVVKIKKSS